MKKAALLGLVVLHVACARGAADLDLDDNDTSVDPAEGEDGGASGGTSTGTSGSTNGGTSAGSSGNSTGINTGGTSTGATTGINTGGSTGMSTGASTGTSTGGTSGGSTGATTGSSTGGTTGATTGSSTGGTTAGSSTGAECGGGDLTCEQAIMLGSIDASNESSLITKQGTGSAWFSIDLSDGNLNNMGNSRIGVRATLAVTSGNYQVTLMGDTSPNLAGSCAAADVTDTTALTKSAIWGSYGPVVAKTRALTFHVEHLDGPCDGPWTLTVVGNPCPAASIGFGENSLGSCP